MTVVAESIDQILAALQERHDLADHEDAVGIVLEVVTAAGYRQLIGPYDKDTADVFAAIESLASEEDSDDEPNVYNLVPLFPPHYAMKPSAL